MNPVPHNAQTPETSPPSPTAPAVPANKKGLLLPILLMITPALLLVASIILYALVNFIAASTAQSTPASGDSLFAESAQTPMHTLLNVILFFMGIAGVMGTVPCFVIGLVLLIQRLKK